MCDWVCICGLCLGKGIYVYTLWCGDISSRRFLVPGKSLNNQPHTFAHPVASWFETALDLCTGMNVEPCEGRRRPNRESPPGTPIPQRLPSLAPPCSGPFPYPQDTPQETHTQITETLTKGTHASIHWELCDLYTKAPTGWSPLGTSNNQTARLAPPTAATPAGDVQTGMLVAVVTRHGHWHCGPSTVL